MQVIQWLKDVLRRRIWLYRLVTVFTVLALSNANYWLIQQIPYSGFVNEVVMWLPLLKSVSSWAVFQFLPICIILYVLMRIPFILLGKQYLKHYDGKTRDSDDGWFAIHAIGSGVGNIAEITGLISSLFILFIEVITPGYIMGVASSLDLLGITKLFLLGLFILYVISYALIEGPKMTERAHIYKTFSPSDKKRSSYAYNQEMTGDDA